MLDTLLEIEGLQQASQATTQLGQAIEGLEPLIQRLNGVAGSFQNVLGGLTAQIESANEALAGSPKEKSAEDRAREEAQATEREMSSLRAKMAQMVGGGVNYAAYEQQLGKIRDQIGLIRTAEEQQVLSKREALEATKKLNDQYSKLRIEAAAYGLVGGGALGRLAAGITSRLQALPGQAVGAAKSQVAGIGTGVMGLLMQSPLGNANGGLFGLMLHGQMNADRIRAETGEIMNIAVSASGSVSQSTIGFLGGFQQQAEHYFGISRQEVQGVLKTFTEAGVSINDIMQKQSKSLGLVGHDIMTLTLGIDKHFELASGTTARTAVSLMADYGISVKEAGDLTTKLAFAGSRSGMGVQNFLNAVMQGSGALREYGAGVENIAGTMLKLQERYEAMGVPKQLAGTLAAQGMGQVTQGIAGMSNTMQSYFGERMGMGTGLEARMNFRDGLQRMSKEGGNNQFTSSFMSQAYKTSMEASGGDKTQARFFLEQQGFGFEGSKAIMEIGGHLEKGGKLQDLSIKEQQNLKDAFKTEGQKTSDIQKNIYTTMQGMAEVGEGLMQVISNFVAIGIVFFKGMPSLIMGDDAERKATMEQIKSFYGDIGTGWGKIVAGGKLAGKGIVGLVGPILQPISDAITWNPQGTSNNVQMVREKEVAHEAEKAAVKYLPSMMQAEAFKKTGSQMQTSGNATVRSIGRGIEDMGILGEGLSTGLARGASSLWHAAGGADFMQDARDRAVAEERVRSAPTTSMSGARTGGGTDPKTGRQSVTATVTVRNAPGTERPQTP